MARVRSHLPRKQVSGLALKESGLGSIPIRGNDFLLHPVEARRLNINEKEGIKAFSGERKDSSSRHETTEGPDGPGWNTLGHRETPQQENADQLERPSEPSCPLEMTTCAGIYPTVVLTSCCYDDQAIETSDLRTNKCG